MSVLTRSAAPTAVPGAPAPPAEGAVRALVLATLGFALSCWAWALLSPLGPVIVARGTLPEASLMVALPVLVGSLGRIPVGALTDRLGGRVMFPAVSLAAVVPVLFLGLVGQDSAVGLLLGAVALGIAGTSFAIGIPYVNSWFPAGRRGLATGIFGASMGGTAISALTTVPLVGAVGEEAPFLLVAAVLVLYALIALRWMPTSPTWSPSPGGAASRCAAAARLPITWQASYLYAVSFGGYVAFSVSLPTLLTTWYDLGSAAASLWMGAFVLVAVLVRPLGGVLSDRFGSRATLAVSYLTLLPGALLLAVHPPLWGPGSAALAAIAVGAGLGAGAVFALVAQVTPPDRVGAVTGLVGAAGGLGGFLPPLLLAASLERTGSYSGALLLLGAACLAALAITRVIRR